MEPNIKRVRLARGISQLRLAASSGMDTSTISRIELGKQAPRDDTLKRLAEALDCEISDFFNTTNISPFDNEQTAER